MDVSVSLLDQFMYIMSYLMKSVNSVNAPKYQHFYAFVAQIVWSECLQGRSQPPFTCCIFVSLKTIKWILMEYDIRSPALQMLTLVHTSPM